MFETKLQVAQDIKYSNIKTCHIFVKCLMYFLYVFALFFSDGCLYSCCAPPILQLVLIIVHINICKICELDNSLYMNCCKNELTLHQMLSILFLSMSSKYGMPKSVNHCMGLVFWLQCDLKQFYFTFI